ncbi:MAG: helix-turn-helix domain-containing protein [Ruminococcaceae bacterium]|nr:helix-turn-helix domain-containing protein [Clostridiales bacterium]MBD5130108.1 helix-turn-helix domain-containing protein [Oscillospiraceae bacterium]
MASHEERKQAVEHCIAHGKDYTLAAAHYGFTYQQIYGWVGKYHRPDEHHPCPSERNDKGGYAYATALPAGTTLISLGTSESFLAYSLASSQFS